MAKIPKLEYVASGCNYTRLPNPGAYELPDNLRFIEAVFRALQTIDGKDNHKFSLLYNAYTEKHFGVAFKKYYRPWLHTIHADSGGLQMVTRGQTPTPQLKTDVYESQARDSDIAMSFDEIPIFIAGSRSLRLDMKNRYFDPDRFIETATVTGKNLAEQLEYFAKRKSATKPLFIAQGNCLETYQQWTEVAFKQVPKELQANIGGVAMGGAALGNAMLEDVKRAFYFSQLPVDHSHLHLLGVGSVSRLLPTLVFAQNGVYGEDLWISYDSSTHTSGPEMGRYYLGEKTINFGKARTNIYDIIFEDIRNNFGDVLDFGVDRLHDALTCGGYVNAQNKFGSTKEAVQAFVVLFAASVANFIRHANSVAESKDKLLASVEGVIGNAFSNLYDVKTTSDFKHWESQIGRSLPSNPVRIKATSTVDSLFD
jgi:hypothetical protein